MVARLAVVTPLAKLKSSTENTAYTPQLTAHHNNNLRISSSGRKL